MGLVEYSDSSEEAEDERTETHALAAKKRKLSNHLPPLPSSFLDQYSSTVRTSTQDDPSLHAGRKRVVPHVEGNWPTHLYLEWHPNPTESRLLSEVVSCVRTTAGKAGNSTTKDASQTQHKVNSLLENDLGVQQPLHISLSRPLAIKTAIKDAIFTRLKQSVAKSNVKSFDAHIKGLAWHPNESQTRWFLVLRLHASTELSTLLELCNDVAKEYGQPLLYAEAAGDESHFHISIAWSLQPPASGVESTGGAKKHGLSVEEQHDSEIPYELLGRLSALSVRFDEVKVRIGQDVHAVALKMRRGGG